LAKKKVEEVVDLPETLLPSVENEVLELDEMWSYVQNKKNKRWLWVALCRRTRQVIAFFLGDRSEKSCQHLWDLVPSNYKHSTTFSDFWAAYDKVIQTGKHTSVGKETGETAHIERWNNTLRQRIGRYVRKTLSFSKCELNHFLFTHWFIINYNKSLIN
jgi:insertion element IS1 protein InsB